MDELGTTRRPPLMWFGRLAGPVVAVAVYHLLDATELTGPGRATAAVAALMAVWWMTEAMPLAATSLLPIVLFPLLGVADIEQTTRPYANEIIFLFFGGFLLGQAVQRWGLHRRIALHTVLLVGSAPRRLVGGFMVATGFLSMWVSNTATVVMMLPIGVSVLALVADRLAADGADEDTVASWTPFGTGLMLAIAYAASIGSVATIIGTPPNGILAGWLAQRGTPLGFGSWMLLGVPTATVMMVVAWLLLTRVLHRVAPTRLPGGDELIRSELAAMGPVSRGEKLTIVVFVAVASLWVTRPLLQRFEVLAGLDDAMIAIGGAIVLFLLPVRRGVMVLDWAHARRIPWEVLVLFGGGLTLAAAIDANGIAAEIGRRVGGLDALAIATLVAAVALVVVFLTEVTSNTATAAVLIPTLGGAAAGLGIDPMLLVVPATIVATFAFMLPVATPPNAIVFGSGRVTVGQMARTGLLLNLVGVAVTTAVMLTLAPRVFGIDLP